MARSVRDAFRAPADPDPTAIDAAARPLGPRDEAAAADEPAELAGTLDRYQEALYAEGVGGGSWSLLLVLQGMDTSGKGGVIACADALRHTDTDAAPWYVIPSDRKRYRNRAVASLLAEVLADLDPQFPRPDLEV